MKRLRSDRGTAVVEFSIVLPLLLLLLFGIVDFAKAWNYTNDMTHLANEGARLAAVNSNPGAAGGKTLQQYIASQAESAELRNGGSTSIPTAAIVCIYLPGSSTLVGQPVQVRIYADYHLIPFLPHWMGGSSSVQLKGQSTMRLEQAADAYSTTNNSSTCPAT
jgi:Flp pilus assembly protein TadG